MTAHGHDGPAAKVQIAVLPPSDDLVVRLALLGCEYICDQLEDRLDEFARKRVAVAEYHLFQLMCGKAAFPQSALADMFEAVKSSVGGPPRELRSIFDGRGGDLSVAGLNALAYFGADWAVGYFYSHSIEVMFKTNGKAIRQSHDLERASSLAATVRDALQQNGGIAGPTQIRRSALSKLSKLNWAIARTGGWNFLWMVERPSNRPQSTRTSLRLVHDSGAGPDNAA